MACAAKTDVTTLCLLRHGESTWNAEKRIQGQLDPPLSALGRLQAVRVAARLAKEHWDAIYSSDLQRARQTAQAVADATGLPVHLDPALREQGQGKREGMLAEEAKLLYPDPDAPEVGREPVAALTARAIAALERIRDAHPGQRVIVVSHGALLAAFLRAVLGIEGKIVMENTACTVVHWDGTAWQCSTYLDVSHLQDGRPEEYSLPDAE